MNDGFKQRLVGAIVLGSLVLILWPIVFTQTQGPTMDKRSQIPPPPAFEKYAVPKPVRAQNIDPVSNDIEPEKPVARDSVVKDNIAKDNIAKDNVTKDIKSPVVEKPRSVAEKPTLNKKGLPESWVLQVASFSKRNNAEELKSALQKKGYRAYTRHTKTDNGESIRVYVGPKFTKAALAKDKKAIDKAFKVKSMVVRFKQ